MTGKILFIFYLLVVLFAGCVVGYIVTDVITTHYPTETTVVLTHENSTTWEATSNATCNILVGVSDTTGNSDGGKAICEPSSPRISEKLPSGCQIYIAGLIYYHPPQLITGWAECDGSGQIKYYNIVSEDGEGSLWVNVSSGHLSDRGSFWEFWDEPTPTDTTTSLNVTPTPVFDENDMVNYTFEKYTIYYVGGGSGWSSSYNGIDYPMQVYPENLPGGSGGGSHLPDDSGSDYTHKHHRRIKHDTDWYDNNLTYEVKI